MLPLSTIIAKLKPNAKNSDPDYVPVRGIRHQNSTDDFDLDDYVNQFLSGDRKVLLLQGNSGAGKSLYCQQLLQRLWQNYSGNNNSSSNAHSQAIPLLISLPSLKNPIQYVIEEALQSYGLTAEEIAYLKQTQSFIFILDGYDELHQTQNLNVTNKLETWQAKIIITCRSQYIFTLDNYDQYFMPYREGQRQPLLFNEVIIKAFNQSQINQYLQQYVKHHETQWQDWQIYKKYIEEIPGLNKLIETPFLLKIAVEVMPEVVKLFEAQQNQNNNNNPNKQVQLKLTQAKLYDIFVEQWFERQEQKLKANGKLVSTETIKPKLWAYAKALAQAMHQQNITQIIYEETSDLFGEEEASPWKAYFDDQNPEIILLRTNSLLQQVGKNQYTFLHASLIEYFVTKELYDKATYLKVAEVTNNNNIKQPINVAQAAQPTSSKVVLPNPYFNQRLLVKERVTLQFLADRVEEDEKFKQQLFDIVEGSKTDESLKIAAANAITILNLSSVSFSALDLRNIKIPYADLSGAILDGAQLQGADLTGLHLQGAWLRAVNLSGARMGQIDFGELPFIQVEKEVICCCYSPDGRWLAVGCHKIYIYDASSRKLIWELDSFGSCHSIVFNPRSEHLMASGSGDHILLWDLNSGKKLREFFNGIPAQSIAFDSMGELLASVSGIKIYEDDPDFRSYYTCERNSVDIWNLNSGKRQQVIHIENVASIAFSSEGSYLALSSGNVVWLRNVSKNEVLRELTGHTGIVTSIAFDPRVECLASGSEDKTVRLWDLSSGTVLRELAGHTGIITCIAFDPQGGRLASGSVDKSVRLWDLSSGTVLRKFIGHAASVKSVAFAPQGEHLASGSADNTVRLWNLNSGKVLREFTSHASSVESIAFDSRGGRLATGSSGKTIRLWGIKSGEVLQKFKGHTKLITTIAFDSQGEHLAMFSRWDNSIQLCDIESGKVLWKLISDHTDGSRNVKNFVFDPRGKWLTWGYFDESISLYDLRSGEVLRELKFNRGRHTEKLLREWRSRTHSYGGLSYYVDSIDPDGERLALCDRSTMLLLDVNSGKVLQELELTGHTFHHWVTSIAFDSRWKRLAAAQDYNKTVWLLDIRSGKVLQKFKGHTKSVTSIAFDPQGERLASGSEDKTVQLWDVRTSQCIGLLPVLASVHTICWVSTDQGNALGVVSGGSLYYFQLLPQGQSIQFVMQWAAQYSTQLCLLDSNIRQVSELDDNNAEFIQQRGGQGEPLPTTERQKQPIFLSRFNDIQSYVIQGLKKKKWILLQKDTRIDDLSYYDSPYSTYRKAQTILALKSEISRLRQEVEWDRVNRVSEIKLRLKPLMEAVIKDSGGKQSDSFFGKKKLTKSKVAEGMKEALKKLEQEPEMNEEPRNSLRPGM